MLEAGHRLVLDENGLHSEIMWFLGAGRPKTLRMPLLQPGFADLGEDEIVDIARRLNADDARPRRHGI